jgi:hypothetical protein
VPDMPLLLGIVGCGVTLDDNVIQGFADEGIRDDRRARQLAIAEHLPSLSELETE